MISLKFGEFAIICFIYLLFLFLSAFSVHMLTEFMNQSWKKHAHMQIFMWSIFWMQTKYKCKNVTCWNTSIHAHNFRQIRFMHIIICAVGFDGKIISMFKMQQDLLYKWPSYSAFKKGPWYCSYTSSRAISVPFQLWQRILLYTMTPYSLTTKKRRRKILVSILKSHLHVHICIHRKDTKIV